MGIELSDIVEINSNIGGLSAIADHLGSGILVAVAEKPVYANKELANIFGYSCPEDILNLSSYFELIAEHEHSRIKKYAKARHISKTAPKQYDFQGVQSNGTLIYLSNRPVACYWDGKEAILATVTDITKHIKSEEALKLSKASLDNLVQSQADLICRFTPDGVLSFVNKSYEKFVGSKHNEIIGRSIYDDVPQSEHQRLKTYFSELSLEHPSSTIENKNIDSHGNVRIFEWKNYAHFDSNGDKTEIQAVGRDITAQKSTQAALQKSEEQFRVAFNSSHGVATITDLSSGRYIDVNEAWLIQRGYKRQEVIGRTSSELNVWGSDENRAKIISDLKQKGNLTNYETVAYTKDGNARDIVINAEVIEVFGVKYLFISGSDITERKQAEDELRQLAVAFDAMNESVAVLDNSDRFIFTNQRYKELNNAIPESFAPGIQFESHLHTLVNAGLVPDAVGRESEWVQERLSKHNNPLGPFEQERSNGNWILVHEQTLPNGGSIILATNITELKNAQHNLHIALENAEQANRAKSEFLTSMSHELRTPLNAVLGFAQLLQVDPNNPLTSKQNESVENILQGGNHLLSLINDVLDLARIEANKAPLTIEEVSANDIVMDCVAQIGSLASARDISVVDQFGGMPLTLLRTDKLRFKQVLLNLLSNAIKYNKEGGTVTVSGQETENGYLRLSVKDTGIGIASDDHEYMFQMFHRLGSDASIAKEGTGIGLTVTKLLVDNLGGFTGFESKEGVGSTFWFDLPLASNREVIIWEDSLRVGVDAIDKDHQEIFLLMNKASRHSLGLLELERVVAETIDYTKRHFSREEVIMEVCGYPELDIHRDHHQKLITKVLELERTWLNTRNHKDLLKLRHFLRNWWVGHILSVDTTITQYAKGKDTEIRRALERFEV